MVGDILAGILSRKQEENRRRLRHHLAAVEVQIESDSSERGARAEAALRRPPGAPLRAIAEIKRRSPSAGTIRPWAQGDAAAIAQGYAQAGAAAISVLCDGPGFGGSPLDLRRVSRAVSTPLLFKEFVLHPIQVALARATGASMVLLLVRALPQDQLVALARACRAAGLSPVVEAADGEELDRALATEASIIGINARDLRTFSVDVEEAMRLSQAIPPDRIAVFMSGIKTSAQWATIAAGRADAALVGEGLMRAQDPGARLAAWLKA